MNETELKRSVDGVLIGVIISFTVAGEPMVAFSHNNTDAPVVAKTTVALTPGCIGREVALLFEGGDIHKPLIIGLMHIPVKPANNVATDNSAIEVTRGPENSKPMTDIVVDGEEIRVNANKELVLKCGKASITLTSAGKIILRGNYISTRSTGVNRIKGGSVQIN